MSTTKIVAGVVFLAVLSGFGYQYHKATQLEATIAALHQERTATLKQLETVARQVTELTERTRALASAESQARTQATPPPTTPAPVPGVIPKAPQGWWKNGSANEAYEVGVDQNQTWGGMPSAYAASTGAVDGKFGGMMQTISADAYHGQRVKLDGWIKTEGADDGGGHLWMRVDGPERGKSLQFDNMDGRAPKGTTDWQQYSVVLDVPSEATTLNYGFFVQGRGKMWVNGVTITPVGTDVPTTKPVVRPPALPATPVNLGFGQPKT